MQNKQKVDKESCQNNFHIEACLPTEIDIFLPEYPRHIRYTQLLFSWHFSYEQHFYVLNMLNIEFFYSPSLVMAQF